MKKTKEKRVNYGLSIFDRPFASGRVQERFTIYDYITFKNIVVAFVVAAFSIFMFYRLPFGLAAVATALMLLFVAVLVENHSRRKWEDDLMDHVQAIEADYERLARDLARNRNESDVMRNRIAGAAGEFVKNYGASKGMDNVEARMLNGIMTKLAKLDQDYDDVLKNKKEEDEVIIIDPEILNKKSSIKGISDSEIGKRLTDDQVLKLIERSISKDQIDLFLQPIVALPQRKIRFYETFARIRIMQDIYLPAGRYIDIANEKSLMPVVDNLLLLRGLQEVRKAAAGDYNRAFFFNITSITLNDQKFMGDLVEFISNNRNLAPQIIFELKQGDLVSMNSASYNLLEGLAKLGCRFSMDDVKRLSFDFSFLNSRYVRFVKIEADMILKELRKDDGIGRLKRFKAQMDRNGVDLIVEKIEKDKQLIELLDVDIDYGQGFLFGKPFLCETGFFEWN